MIKLETFIKMIFYKIGNQQTKLLILISIVAHIFYFLLTPDFVADDYPSYRHAQNWIDNGSIDINRTPIYPLLLALIRIVTSDECFFIMNISLLQSLFFLFTIPKFQKITLFFCLNSKASFLLTLTYACCPAIIYWNRCIMTESLAISGLVWFIYFLLVDLKEKKFKFSLLIHLSILFLILLRPSFIFLIPVAIIHLILTYKNNLLLLIRNGITLVFTFSILLLYAHSVEKQCNIFTLSTIPIINNYIGNRMDGKLHTDKSTKIGLEIKTLQDKYNLKPEEEAYYLIEKYGYEKVAEAITFSQKHDPFWKPFKTTYRRIVENSKKFFFIPAAFNEDDNSSFGKVLLKGITAININFVQFYFLILILGFYTIYRFKHKNPTTIPCLYTVLILSFHTLLIFFGAYGQYSRLFAPVYPLVILLIGILLDKFCIYYYTKTKQIN